jgi:integrase
MPAFQRRKNADGSVSTTAIVRVHGFKATSKTFKAPTAREADSAANAWATEQESSLRAMRQSGSGAHDITRVTIRDLCARYLADPDVKLLKSWDDYGRQLAWWGNEFGNERAASFGPARLHDARAKLLVGGRAPATVNRYLAALRAAFAWGKRSGLIAATFSWPTRLLLREPRPKSVSLDGEAYRALLAEIAKEPEFFQVPFVLCLATGARRGEAESAVWGDIDLERQSWSIPRNKAELPRAAYLPPFAVGLLRNFAKGRRREDRVMPFTRTYTQKRWTAIRKRLGIADFRWHDLRHAFASTLVANGATLYEAQHALGHRTAASTQRYAHLVTARPTQGHAGLESMFRSDGE